MGKLKVLHNLLQSEAKSLDLLFKITGFLTHRHMTAEILLQQNMKKFL